MGWQGVGWHGGLWWFSHGGFVVVCGGFSHGGFVVVCGGSVMVVQSWWVSRVGFLVVHGGFVVVHGGLWWFSHGGFVVVCGGSWWFSVVVLWWFVVVFFQKSLEKGHVTLYSTNHGPKFTMKSHF